jgi:hypothetical protein
MNDTILNDWLLAEQDRLREFLGQTDLVRVTPYDAGEPHRMYLADFFCNTLVRDDRGIIVPHVGVRTGIAISDDHLRDMEPLLLVSLFGPRNLWHPNTDPTRGLICPGHMRTGVGLIDILNQVHSILSYQNMNLLSVLNPDAAAWAREHRAEFPIDPRPLKRRRAAQELQETV